MQSDYLLIGYLYFFPSEFHKAPEILKSKQRFKAMVHCDNSDRYANFFIHSTSLLLFFPIKANATETVIKLVP